MSTDFNQRQREREAASCVHFNGISNAACAAGVCYNSFPVVPGQGRPLPCIPPFRARPDDVRPMCPKFEAMGMERVLEEEKEHQKHTQRLTIARAAIMNHAGHKRGVRGTLDCPVCRMGQLSYAIAGSNGLVRLSCLRTELNSEGDWKDAITWDELQRLKREAGFGDRQAVEIYPPDREVVNVANIRHLWVLPVPLPFAWKKEGV